MSEPTENTNPPESNEKNSKKKIENPVFLYRYKENHFSSWKVDTQFRTQAEATQFFRSKAVRFEPITAKDLSGLDQWAESNEKKSKN